MSGAVTGMDEENDLRSATWVQEKQVCVDHPFFPDILVSRWLCRRLFFSFLKTKVPKVLRFTFRNYTAKVRVNLLSSRKITLKSLKPFASASGNKKAQTNRVWRYRAGTVGNLRPDRWEWTISHRAPPLTKKRSATLATSACQVLTPKPKEWHYFRNGHQEKKRKQKWKKQYRGRQLW